MTHSPSRLESLRLELADRYRIEREIGAGGMAVVYLATDLRHDRPVAIKVLRPEIANAVGAARFLAEIRITARLDHPRILTLIDSGEAGGLIFYVLPFVRGESLRDLLDREGTLPFARVSTLVEQIASALDHAHRQGIIHRDLKPENILLREGEAMLADFGIALATRDPGNARLTREGHSLGTPFYMSPEQAAGALDLTPQSDVYSLAAMTYEMLSGHPPFTGASAQEVLAKHLAETAPLLQARRADVPPAVPGVLRRSMAKTPGERPAGALAFAAALHGTGEEQTLLLRTGERRRAPGRWWLPAGGLLAALTIVLAIRARPTRIPAPVPIRLTTSGYADLPSISPDGGQVAYAEGRECPPGEFCPVSLMLRETSGEVARPLIESLAYAFPFQWSADGRWILFNGAGPRHRLGQHLVSRLGGPTTAFGNGVIGFRPGSDTLLFSPLDQVGKPTRSTEIRRPPWTTVAATMEFEAPRRDLYLLGLRTTSSGRRTALGWINSLGGEQLMTIHDEEGRIVDSTSVRSTNMLRWTKDERAILIPIEDPSATAGARVIRFEVDQRTGRLGRRDTIPLAPGVEGVLAFDFTPDGRFLVYSGIRTGTSKVLAFRSGQERPTIRATSSSALRALLTPDGSRIVLRRVITIGDSTRYQWEVLPFAALDSAPRAITPPLPQGYAAAVDDRNLYLLEYHSGTGTDLVAYDLASGRPNIRARELPGISAIAPLSDGSVALITHSGGRVRLLAPAGTRAWESTIPDSIGRVVALLETPDGADLLAFTQPGSLILGADGLVPVPVLRFSTSTGERTSAGEIRVESYVIIGMTRDGWVHLGISAGGRPELQRYRWRPAMGAPVRVPGTVRAGCETDSRLLREVCVQQDRLTDIYLIRDLEGL